MPLSRTRQKSGREELEWIVNARDKSDAFAAVADIHVANHKRRGNAAKTDPANRMEPAQRILVHMMEHPSQVDKRRFESAIAA
jgi:hypothetical protein